MKDEGIGPLVRTLCAAALVSAGVAQAQQGPGEAGYPAKPIKMVMPFPAGGPTDILGRLLGQKLTEAWGQNIVIDNRPGGGGMIGGALAAKSPADGYTLFLGGITTLVISTFLQKNMPYDPVRDFHPVTQATIQPILLMVHPSLPAKTVKEIVALARARPGEVNYASSGPGGSGHLAGELFRTVTGTNIVHVPYRGAPPALTDLMSGQVQVMFGHTAAVRRFASAGSARGVTGPALRCLPGCRRSRSWPAELRCQLLERHARAHRHAARHHRQAAWRTGQDSAQSQRPRPPGERRADPGWEHA
jgi:tripartite-type tricarboxylate transporter receptor subunit TctC